jgi:2,5-diamino-6-(ribosylamino)-4(3H)-pyrimidinone 5'-phosphate reductase
MPKIIMHNQVSLDGAISGFQIDAAAYYTLLNSYRAGMYLVGSDTAISGIKTFSKNITPEEPSDFEKPEPQPDDHRPVWVIPDSEGKLLGLLHIFRRYEHCRDIIVLVSSETPKNYLAYLIKRKYNHIIAGEIKVDLKYAMKQIGELFPFETMVTDNGGKLSSILLENSLIDQISLIVSPTLTGKKTPKLFRDLKLGKRVIKLNPVKAEILPNRDILMLFDVVK